MCRSRAFAACGRIEGRKTRQQETGAPGVDKTPRIEPLSQVKERLGKRGESYGGNGVGIDI